MRLFQKKEGAPAKGLPRRILPLALAAFNKRLLIYFYIV